MLTTRPGNWWWGTYTPRDSQPCRLLQCYWDAHHSVTPDLLMEGVFAQNPAGGILTPIGIFPNFHNESNKICALASMADRQNEAGFQILSGWKEIASYLGKGVRTIQRYERELRLPVYRPAGKSSSSVIALKTELDRWVKGVPVQLDERAMRLRAQTNNIGAQFLQVDAEVALTFVGMALKARSPEKRDRQADAARKAYDTIMRLRQKFDLSEPQRDKLDASLRRLKSELHELQKKF